MKTAKYATLFLTCLLSTMPVAAYAAPPIPLDKWYPGNTPAPPSKYVISTDGLEATDPNTGLIWRRCVEGLSWTGSACVGDPTVLPHQGALQHAADEAASTGLSWRLPSLKELASIGYTERHSDYPAIDHAAFPNTPPQWYWSSSLDESNPGKAWYLSFVFGGAGTDDRNNMNYVRLVRGGH